MLKEAIEKNEPYLRFCSSVAQFSGSLLLLLGFISIVMMLWNFCQPGRFPKHDVALVYKVISPFIFRQVFLGLFLLGISKLIKCLIDINFKPNWILKFSDKIIYLYVVLLIINFIFFFNVSNGSDCCQSTSLLDDMDTFRNIYIRESIALGWHGASFAKNYSDY